MGMSTTSREDLISDLPDDLLYVILKHLQLRDAVKTSALSHRWNHVFLSASILQFDWVHMFLTDANREFWETSENPCTTYEENFRKAVNEFIQSYQGTYICTFTVSYCLGCQSTKETNDIDKWVKFALKRGVVDLSIKLYCSKDCCRNENTDSYGQQVDDKYILRIELFDGVKLNLKRLCLVACILGPKFTYQFGSLVELCLDSIPLALFDLQNLLSYLENLKHLLISKCTLPSKLTLSTLRRLLWFQAILSAGLQEIELSNAKLIGFECICGEVVKCNLLGAPNLTILRYSVSATEYQHMFTYFPVKFPMLRALLVERTVDWAKCTPECKTTFNCVTQLVLLFSLQSKFSILNIMSILRAFPQLRDFRLSTDCSEDVDQDMLESCEYIPVHLKKVETRLFYSTPNQMEFAIYLLKNACALKQLIITSKLVEERQMIFERLKEFAKDGVLVVN